MPCPATGRMSHNYDKETHRCKGCNRWQAGFKPKTESKTPRAECQICEGRFALTGGLMVHHGYKRPGWGFIVGDCMAVGCKPYPATDALERYKVMCEKTAAIAVERIAELEAATELEYKGVKYNVLNHREKTEFRVTIRKGDHYTYTKEHGSLPGFAELQRQKIWEVRQRLDGATSEAVRAGKRIEAARQMVAGDNSRRPPIFGKFLLTLPNAGVG